LQHERPKPKTFPTREKAKTLNSAIQLEDKVSRSRSKHEGESSSFLLRQGIGRTRGSSQRQVPTDHDYAVSTREYQLDQSSPLPATAAADLVLDRKNDQRTLTGHYISKEVWAVIRPQSPAGAVSEPKELAASPTTRRFWHNVWMPISTRDLSRLPSIDRLEKITQSIAMLDAIVSPNWEYRYFSFNGEWDVSRKERMASMRDGSGDEYFMLFSPKGAILKGFDHESPMSPWQREPVAVWPGILERGALGRIVANMDTCRFLVTFVPVLMP
jgi:hypothetical protein